MTANVKPKTSSREKCQENRRRLGRTVVVILEGRHLFLVLFSNGERYVGYSRHLFVVNFFILAIHSSLQILSYN